MNPKRRILIPINGQGTVVHIIRSGMLDEIAKYMQPVLMLYWQDPSFEKEMRSCGYEVYALEIYGFSPQYYRLYNRINTWYTTKAITHNSIKLTKQLHTKYKRKNRKVKTKIKDWLNRLLVLSVPALHKTWIIQEQKLMMQEMPYIKYRQWMTEKRIDYMFTVSPFLQEINLMGRVLSDMNKPVIASIHSFDNVTKRNWQPFLFHHYLVWNKHNQEELEGIYKHLNKKAVTITGAPQFDYHFDASFIMPKEEWLKLMGLPAGKKIVLYAGGADVHFPTEPQYVAYLNEAIINGKIDADTVVLVRSHPLCKIDRWKEFIGITDHVFFYQPSHGTDKYNYGNVNALDISILISSLYYSDVHINLCSSMTIDGSIFNKPQIAPYFDDINKRGEPALRAIYNQKHFKPVLDSGVLQFAATKSALIELVNENLKNPRQTAGSKRCVEEIITYTDGQSAKRVANHITSFFGYENNTSHT